MAAALEVAALEQQVVAKEAKIVRLEQQLENTGQENLELLTALQRQLAALREEKVLLMRQAGAAGSPRS
jgi:hypothetical protein